MSPVRAAIGILVVSAALHGQSSSYRVQATCTAELIGSLSLPCSAEEPCPLYLELASVELVGNLIFVTGNIHTGAATVQSILLASDDGGSTWKEAHSRISQAVLDQIQFIDFEAGWISGHILQSTPKDAFFLLSTDGGKSWHKQPIAGEPRTGAVEQFFFDSRTHGLLTIDRVRAAENGLRYELWETMTGGASWSIRQVNGAPLTLTRPQREAPLRIRTDSNGKLHRIEKRSGSRWITIATLAVSAGECKPPEPAESGVDAPPQTLPSAEPSRPPASGQSSGRAPTLRNKK